MTNITESATWPSSVYLIGVDDDVYGGLDGTSNKQGIALANRSQWLKAQIASVISQAGITLDVSKTNQLRDAIQSLINTAIVGWIGSVSDLIGTDPDKIPRCFDLGRLAFMDTVPTDIGVAFLNVAQSWGATQSASIATLTDASSIAWNLATSNLATVTIATNRTLANPTNMVAGGLYGLRVVVGAAGSVLSYGSAYKGVSGISLATTLNAVNHLVFRCNDGSTMELIGYRAGVAA